MMVTSPTEALKTKNGTFSTIHNHESLLSACGVERESETPHIPLSCSVDPCSGLNLSKISRTGCWNLASGQMSSNSSMHGRETAIGLLNKEQAKKKSVSK